MDSIRLQFVKPALVAVLLFLSESSNLQAQVPTLDQSKKDAAGAAFEQAEQLRKEGSAESLKKALEKYDEVLVFWRAFPDRRNEARTLVNIGVVYGDLGEMQKALDYYNQALPLTRAVSAGEAATLSNIGGVYSDLGEKQKALDCYNQALRLNPHRQAQLALLQGKTDAQTSFAHPYYWAPFILIGNWK